MKSPKVDYKELIEWISFFEEQDKNYVQQHLLKTEAKIISPGLDVYLDTLRAAALIVLFKKNHPRGKILNDRWVLEQIEPEQKSRLKGVA